MKQITLNIKENKLQFFLDLIQNFDFVQIQDFEGDSKEEIIRNLKQGFKEMKLHKEGEVSATSLADFIDEL